MEDEKVEPIELLEENWFFRNFFHGRTTIARCASAPPSSWSSCQQEMGGENKRSSMEVVAKDDYSVHRNFLRTPSLPPRIGKLEAVEVDQINQKTSSNTSYVFLPQRISKSTSVGRHGMLKESSAERPSKDIENPFEKQSSSIIKELWDDSPVHHHIVRTPSVPPAMRREVAGMEGGSRTFMRQASFDPSLVLPSQQISKTITPSPSIRKHRMRRETKVDKSDSSCSSGATSKTLSRWKTMNDLEIEELKGFIDLGFTFHQEDLNPSVVNIIPALKSKNEANWDEDKVSRPYLSEAWLENRSPPPFPNWIDRRSSVGDMKEQLKFWARAVASSVRQEC